MIKRKVNTPEPINIVETKVLWKDFWGYVRWIFKEGEDEVEIRFTDYKERYKIFSCLNDFEEHIQALTTSPRRNSKAHFPKILPTKSISMSPLDKSSRQPSWNPLPVSTSRSNVPQIFNNPSVETKTTPTKPPPLKSPEPPRKTNNPPQEPEQSTPQNQSLPKGTTLGAIINTPTGNKVVVSKPGEKPYVTTYDDLQQEDESDLLFTDPKQTTQHQETPMNQNRAPHEHHTDQQQRDLSEHPNDEQDNLPYDQQLVEGTLDLESPDPVQPTCNIINNTAALTIKEEPDVFQSHRKGHKEINELDTILNDMLDADLTLRDDEPGTSQKPLNPDRVLTPTKQQNKPRTNSKTPNIFVTSRKTF